MQKFCFPLFLFASLILPTLRSADLPLIFRDDFTAGAKEWESTDPKAWKITEIDGNPAYEILGGSQYEPPFRSPLNIAIRRDGIVGDFIFTARVRTTRESYDHRDMCVVFGYQNPSNFYYIHLGQRTDPHANQIFLVNEAPRVAISEKTTEGTPWVTGKWHDVKIVRTVASGRIEVYFDDMTTPTHLAHDKTFTWGRVGIGTFDDKGIWDDVELHGVAVEPPASASREGHPSSLIYTKWTPNFQVPDPVAISFDPQSRAYVTQTQRRKANDLDIRDNTDWIPNDLSFESPDDKLAFYRSKFTPENSAANAHRVEDYNGDGRHDIHDLTVLSERIYRIEDTNGDGTADSMKIYAEQLNHPIGGVAGGVLWYDGSVYACPVPELVSFRDKDGDGVADEKKELVYGFGAHLAYAGHDMHGLFLGPDGRIYWSVGDKGIRVKTPDGLDYRFPHQGGLMRCEPDGSQFEVFAHGQRNIQEISFDQYGNFFGVDNDADFAGEKERLVFIEQYGDLGWRSHWQYLRDDYNPWDSEKMHVPWHADQSRWFTPTIGNYENGPAGFKFNPGTALSPAYENYFFLTSAPNGQQWAFRIEPHGDSWAMHNDHQIGDGIPLVGLCFAPDGGLYSVDWGGGYPMNEKGAVWRIDVAKDQAHPLRAETQMLIEADFAKKALSELSVLLGYADQRVRLKAQLELAKRSAIDQLRSVATSVDAPQIARIHAIWGIGQLQRWKKADDAELTALLGDPDPEIRAQAIRTLTDKYGRLLGLDRIPSPDPQAPGLTKALIPHLEDPSQRVRIQALMGLGRLRDPLATEAIIGLLARKEHHPGMTALRHAGTMALAGAAPVEALAALSKDKSVFVRTCAALALGRRGDPAVTAFLEDSDSLISADAAIAIHDDWMIPEAMPALAAHLGKHLDRGSFVRRAINANFRIGTTEAAERIVSFVAEGKADESLLEAGLEALQNWVNPPKLDLVTGQFRPLESRDPDVLTNALKAHIDTLLTSKSAKIVSGVMELATKAELPIANGTLLAVFSNAEADGALRATALHSLAAQKASGLTELISAAAADPAIPVQIAVLDLLSETQPDEAKLEIQKRLDGKAATAVKQHAIRSLARVKEVEPMRELLAKLQAGKLSSALRLDVYEAAQDPAFSSDSIIVTALTAIEKEWTKAAVTDPVAPFRYALEGGNSERGKSIILNHPAAQCAGCHRIDKGPGSNVGPILQDIGKKRDRAYILQSLIDPQVVVAKGYGNLSLSLNDGTTVAGQFLEEKDGKVILKDISNKQTEIPVANIRDRSAIISTMPPMGLILNKAELRDVVAYLARKPADDPKKQK